MAQIRQNYSTASEDAINKQINLELYASYCYLSMAYHFNRDDVALKGFYKLFKESSEEEREHAQKFMKYQNDRGGRLTYTPIQTPEKVEFSSGLEAMEHALKLERHVNESLLNLHRIASSSNDAHLTDFLEGEFLNEQVESIKKLGDHITNLKRVGPNLGEFIFDKELHEEKS